MTTILSGARLVLPDSTIERGSLLLDEDGLIEDVWAEPMPKAPGSFSEVGRRRHVTGCAPRKSGLMKLLSRCAGRTAA